MRIDRIQNNNQTSFGIQYRNIQAWNKNLFNTFETSELVKEIDKKYPKAKVQLIKIFEEDSFANSEPIHTLIMDIELAKDKFFRWHLSSHMEQVPEQNLIKTIKTITLDNVEQESAEKLMPLMSLDIKYKQNPIKAFFQKIFS